MPLSKNNIKLFLLSLITLASCSPCNLVPEEKYMLDNFLIQLFHQGNCLEMYKVFGAHFEEVDGQKGVRFTVYAPHAKGVQVVGSFNNFSKYSWKVNLMFL